MQETRVQSLDWEDPLEMGMATHPVFLPGKSHGQRSLVGYSPQGHEELDMTERLTLSLFTSLWLAHSSSLFTLWFGLVCIPPVLHFLCVNVRMCAERRRRDSFLACYCDTLPPVRSTVPAHSWCLANKFFNEQINKEGKKQGRADGG